VEDLDLPNILAVKYYGYALLAFNLCPPTSFPILHCRESGAHFASRGVFYAERFMYSSKHKV
jgi:hypothetical protein